MSRPCMRSRATVCNRVRAAIRAEAKDYALETASGSKLSRFILKRIFATRAPTDSACIKTDAMGNHRNDRCLEKSDPLSEI